jgi:predicted RNA-binding Zn-ribbon protein involved in translation (DUF1610 family)
MSDKKICSCPICNSEVNPAEGRTGDEQIIIGIIALSKELQEQNKCPDCPRCGERMAERNALSRQFDINVCPDCGNDETVRARAGNELPAAEWWAVKEIFSLRERRGVRKL